MSLLNPEAIGNPPIEDKSLNIGETIDFLNADDNDEGEVIELDGRKTKDDKVIDEKDKDDKGEKKTLEESIKEELDEDENRVVEEIDTPLVRREILTKYPTLFKDFPGLETAMYRDRRFTEMFPTFDDAETANEKSQMLDAFEQDISNGSSESILSTIRDNDKETFAKMVDGYLPSLFAVDEAAYYHVCGNVIKQAIITMVQTGREEKDQDLLTAAEILHEHVFHTKKFSPPTRLSRTQVTEKSNEKEEELSEREREFEAQRFTSALDSVSTKVNGIVERTISKNLDPNNSMAPYVRKIATRDINESLEKAIQNDREFMRVYDRLWERAASDGYKADGMDRIQKAYLSKARTLLPELIRKARSEAIQNRKANDNNDNKRGPLPVGKVRSAVTPQNNGQSDRSGKVTVPKGMTSLDFLNSD